MKPRLDWIQVLNEQSEWRQIEDVKKWFELLLGRKVQVTDAVLKAFDLDLCRLRQLVYDHHFQRTLDLSWLEERLQSIRFAFHAEPEKNKLPSFRACAAGDDDSSLLVSVSDTLIHQCAQFVSDYFLKNDGADLCRCQGLYRDQNALNTSVLPAVPVTEEILWRQELAVLVEKNLQEEAQIQRCADLFVGDSRSRFCSDACRFSTFQIIKQLQDPAYLAEKQKRYRQKKES
ncbi:MAG: hypothetical protein K2W82_01485 [Candidatus Obscuribacterales bacterium]|nr:hypothetical protein [Candidatus Obscuribacterales bacterium]